MKADLTFRGMDHTQAMEDYVAKNLKKFNKYLGKEDPEATFVHVVLEGQQKHNVFKVEIRVKTPHFDVIAGREGKEMYPLIDEVMRIMERELEQEKQKLLDAIQKRDKFQVQYFRYMGRKAHFYNKNRWGFCEV